MKKNILVDGRVYEVTYEIVAGRVILKSFFSHNSFITFDLMHRLRYDSALTEGIIEQIAKDKGTVIFIADETTRPADFNEVLKLFSTKEMIKMQSEGVKTLMELVDDYAIKFESYDGSVEGPEMYQFARGKVESFVHECREAKVYGFFHCSCIYESSDALISLHTTKRGAWEAMHQTLWARWVSEFSKTENRAVMGYGIRWTQDCIRQALMSERFSVRAITVMS